LNKNEFLFKEHKYKIYDIETHTTLQCLNLTPQLDLKTFDVSNKSVILEYTRFVRY